MLGRTLDTKIVEEMREARTGGEYAALLGENAMGNNERYEPIMFFFWRMTKRPFWFGK